MSLSAAVVGQALVAVSGILAARALGPEGRGYLALFIVMPLIFAQLGMAVPVAATYYIARAPEWAGDVVARLRMPGTLQVLVLAVAHAAVLLVVLFSQDEDVRNAGLISLPAVPILLVQQYGLGVLQGLQEFRGYNVLRTGPAFLYALAAVVLIALGEDTLTGFVAGWIGAAGLSMVATTVVARRRLPAATGHAEVPTSSTILRFGRRSLLGTTSPVEYFQVDQVIAGFVVSVRALGLYVAGAALTNLVRFIGQCVGTVAYPQVAARHDEEDQRRTLLRFFMLTAALSGAVVLVLEVLAGTLVPFLFGADFTEAVPISRVLLVAALLFSLRRCLTEAGRGAGHAGMGSLAEVASWIVLGAGVAVLVPPLGVVGVAWAMTFSAAVSLALLSYAVFRHRPSRVDHQP